MGAGAAASGVSATSLGASTVASGAYAAAVGIGAQATAESGAAVGAIAKATGKNISAFGKEAVASGASALASGASSVASANSSTALGTSAIANITGAVALGSESVTRTDKGAVGYAPLIEDWDKKTIDQLLIAIDPANEAKVKNLPDAMKNAEEAVKNADQAVKDDDGSDPAALTQKKAALAAAQKHLAQLRSEAGKLVNTWQSSLAAVSLGDVTTGKTRQITNLAAGREDTDAVNVAQLKQLAKAGILFKSDLDQDAGYKPSLGETVHIFGKEDAAIAQGAYATDYTDANIVTSTVTDENGAKKGVKIWMSKNPLVEGVKFGDDATTAKELKPNDDKSKLTYDGKNLAFETPEEGKGDVAPSRDAVAYTDDAGKRLFAAEDGKYYEGPVTVIDGKAYEPGAFKGTDNKVYPAGTVKVDGKYYAPDQIENGKPKDTATVATELQPKADGKEAADVRVNMMNPGDKDAKGDATKLGNVAKGEADTDAVNVSQLKKFVAGEVNKGLTFAADKGAAKNAKLGDTITVAGGKGASTSIKDGTITVDLDAEQEFNSVTLGKGKLSGDAAGNVYLGDQIHDNGLVTFKDLTDTVGGVKWTGKVKSEGTGTVKGGDFVVTKDKPLIFVAGDNVALETRGNDLVVGLSKTPNFETVTTTGGFKVENGPALNPTGLDNAGNKIVNVAPGVDDTDAVNVSQLKDAMRVVGDDTKARRAGAMGAALAAMHPIDYDEEHPTMFTAGYGHYEGAHAWSLGVMHYFTRDLLLSAGMSLSGPDKAFNLGATIRFGASPKYEARRVSTHDYALLKKVELLQKDNVAQLEVINKQEQVIADLLKRVEALEGK